MSIEIPTSTVKIRVLAAETGFIVSDVVRASGVSSEQARTVGSNAGDYAAQLLLGALVELGLVDLEPIDPSQVAEAIRDIADRAGINIAVAEMNAFEEEVRLGNGR